MRFADAATANKASRMFQVNSNPIAVALVAMRGYDEEDGSCDGKSWARGGYFLSSSRLSRGYIIAAVGGVLDV